MFKFVAFCVLATFAKSISCQCLRGPMNAGIVGPVVEPVAYGNPMAYGAEYANPWCEGYGLNLATLAASNRCGFTVTSASPIAPNGVSILSENMVIEGPLAINGQLPFLGTIGVEGSLPAVGAGVVTYGCGNGNIGITNEVLPGAGYAGYAMPGPYGPAPAGAPVPIGMGMNGINGINAINGLNAMKGLYGGCGGLY